jgi:hypothetical protein
VSRVSGGMVTICAPRPSKGMARVLPFVIVIALLVASCSTTPALPDGPSGDRQGLDLPASSETTASPSAVGEPDGTFVFIPSAIDCPGGCPTVSVSEAVAEPGEPGAPPILVEGAILI